MVTRIKVVGSMYSNKRCRFHGTHIIIFCCLLLSLTAAETSNSRRVHTLTLVQEYKLTDCLDTQPNVDFEASGIISVGNELYVCFDNMPAVAIVDRELSVCAARRTPQPASTRPGGEGRGGVCVRTSVPGVALSVCRAPVEGRGWANMP